MLLLTTALLSMNLFLADPPPDADPPTPSVDAPAPPDRPLPPPDAPDERRRPRPPRPPRPPQGGPDLPPFPVDVDIDVEFGGHPHPGPRVMALHPPGGRRRLQLSRDGERWVLEGVDLSWKATGDKLPMEMSAEMFLFRTKDGQEIEVRPAAHGPMGHPPGAAPGVAPVAPPPGSPPVAPPPPGGQNFPRFPHHSSMPHHDAGPPNAHRPPAWAGPHDSDMDRLGQEQMRTETRIRALRDALRSMRDKEADSPERQSAEKDLDAAVRELFQLRQDLRKRMLENVTRDVDRLRQSIESRESRKEDLIRERIEEILEEEEEF